MDELILIVTILVPAACFDRFERRIPNALVLLGYGEGLTFFIRNGGGRNWPELIVRAVWPVAVLYLPFLIRGIGAGDLKLFSCMAVTFGNRDTGVILFLSFLIAAAASLRRMIRTQTLWARLRSLMEYGLHCAGSMKALPYVSPGQDNHLAMAPCIAAASFIFWFWKEGRLWIMSAF